VKKIKESLRQGEYRKYKELMHRKAPKGFEKCLKY
jgi:hypothetical protein